MPAPHPSDVLAAAMQDARDLLDANDHWAPPAVLAAWSFEDSALATITNLVKAVTEYQTWINANVGHILNNRPEATA